MTKRREALPCPICGQQPAVECRPEHYSVFCNGTEHCLTCAARKTQKEALALWNKLVRPRTRLILVHYDSHEGSEFDVCYTLEAADYHIAQYIKKNGGKRKWEQRNESVWAHDGGEDFINIVELCPRQDKTTKPCRKEPGKQKTRKTASRTH